MRFLWLSSCLLVVLSCKSPYKALIQRQWPVAQAIPSKPVFEKVLYKAQIEVVGKHLSGLLFFKSMPDSSRRVVFASEAGLTFFDFGFKGADFKVYSIIPQFNKKGVVKTLRSDLNLLLFEDLGEKQTFIKVRNNQSLYPFIWKNETHYFIPNENGDWNVVEVTGKRTLKAKANFGPLQNGLPTHATVQHYYFDMKIDLQQIETTNSESTD